MSRAMGKCLGSTLATLDCCRQPVHGRRHRGVLVEWLLHFQPQKTGGGAEGWLILYFIRV